MGESIVEGSEVAGPPGDDGPLVLLVTTPHCPFCVTVRGHCEPLALELPEVSFREISAPDHPDLAKELGIRSAPTLLAFEGGRELTRLTGSATESDVRKLFRATLGQAEVRRYTVSTDNRIARIGAGLVLGVAGAVMGMWWLVPVGAALIGFGLYDRLL